MKVNVIPVLLAALLFAPLSAQNIVSAPQKRQEILDKLGEVMAHDPVAWPDGSVTRVSPFRPVEARPTVPVVRRPVESSPTGTQTVVIQPQEPTRLSDRDALVAIVPAFNPRGTILMGKVRMLTMANRKIYREGDVVAYNVRGDTYQLVVEKVTIDGYTLRLGNARVQRSFKNND